MSVNWHLAINVNKSTLLNKCQQMCLINIVNHKCQQVWQFWNKHLMVLYKTDEWQFQHTVLNSLKFWVPWGVLNHLSLSKSVSISHHWSRRLVVVGLKHSGKCLKVPIWNIWVGVIWNRWAFVCPKLSHKKVLLFASCMPVDKITHILSQNQIFWLKITWDIFRSRPR